MSTHLRTVCDCGHFPGDHSIEDRCRECGCREFSAGYDLYQVRALRGDDTLHVQAIIRSISESGNR